MRLPKILICLLLAHNIHLTHAEDAVAQPPLSDLVATARQMLALKAMTVSQLLTRVQLPAIQWDERHQIVEELRVRPAREVLPLLYQILTARGPYYGYNGWGADPYIYGGGSTWYYQVRYVLDKLWSYQTGVEGFEDLDDAYNSLTENPYTDETAKKLAEAEKKRDAASKKRHQEIGQVLLTILRHDKIKGQTIRIMDGFVHGYSWTEEALPDVIAACGDAKISSLARGRAMEAWQRWSPIDSDAALMAAVRHLPMADLADKIGCLRMISYGQQELRGDLPGLKPNFQVLQFGFELLKQVEVMQGPQSENAIEIAADLRIYANVNFAPNAPADLKPQPSKTETEQYDKEVAVYAKTLVQPALAWWQQNAAKYEAQDKHPPR